MGGGGPNHYHWPKVQIATKKEIIYYEFLLGTIRWECMNYSEIFSAYNLQVVRYFISSQVLLKIFYFTEELSDKKNWETLSTTEWQSILLKCEWSDLADSYLAIENLILAIFFLTLGRHQNAHLFFANLELKNWKGIDSWAADRPTSEPGFCELSQSEIITSQESISCRLKPRFLNAVLWG